MQIRRLTLDDHDSSLALAVEAFGSLPAGATAPPRPTELPRGREVWGAFDDDRIMARVAGHEYESWWHGQRIRTCGVASVAVAAERRGEGVLLPLFEAMLGAAAERGEALSTLYPTASGIYRPLGYELVASYDTVEIATSELARVRPATTTRARRAEAADVDAVKAVYATWASAQNGPLTRTGHRFAMSDEEVIGDVTATTLAVDADDRVVGYASWDRGTGYDATASLEVHDLVATTLDGYRTLWTVLGSHTSVTGTVRLHTSGDDPARLVLPTATWDVVQRHPYMLRVSDPAAALTAAALTLPGLATTEIPFAVIGDSLGAADGTYLLTVGSDGPGRCERTPVRADVATYTPQGLALAFAGVQSSANLRMTEHLTGPSNHDTLLDALLGGRPLHVRDYF